MFLPLVFAVFFSIPHKWRWLLLLIASYIFYGWWHWEFLFLIAASTLVDFNSARKIENSINPKTRKFWLGISLTFNFSVLFFFKYFYFFVGSTDYVQSIAHNHQSIKQLIDFLGKSLPVGISFYTFQTMSYVLDVYYKRAKAESHIGHYALFVSY
ncbi:MAG: MBOAT family protein, partial [Bacteroidia bacterium]|nr:MBOAT family protein [Bacteroidia bacterium]